jgi:hypothetical protein
MKCLMTAMTHAAGVWDSVDQIKLDDVNQNYHKF